MIEPGLNGSPFLFLISRASHFSIRASYEDKLQKGELPKNSREKLIRNKQITDLRNQIKDIQYPPKEVKVHKTELDKAKGRIQAQIDNINERIKNKDFEPTKKKVI